MQGRTLSLLELEMSRCKGRAVITISICTTHLSPPRHDVNQRRYFIYKKLIASFSSGPALLPCSITVQWKADPGKRDHHPPGLAKAE